MNELAPCPACKRHVATHELDCPFCRRAVALRAQHVVLTGRVSRAAMFAAALLGTGCWTESKPPSGPPLRERLDKLPAGTIRGVVRDQDGAPRAGYTISVQLPDGSVRETRSDARGEYSLANLPPGTYEVQYFNSPRPRYGVRVTLDDRTGATAELVVYRIEHIQPATPYGAPPARRRIV
ncbi:MAG TPA: carboxypeptidase-like regulatory domain-containing protein [Kofleriaceae bacterium]